MNRLVFPVLLHLHIHWPGSCCHWRIKQWCS